MKAKALPYILIKKKVPGLLVEETERKPYNKHQQHGRSQHNYKGQHLRQATPERQPFYLSNWRLTTTLGPRNCWIFSLYSLLFLSAPDSNYAERFPTFLMASTEAFPTKTQAWGCPHGTSQHISRRLKHLSLGMPKASPSVGDMP